MARKWGKYHIVQPRKDITEVKRILLGLTVIRNTLKINGMAYLLLNENKINKEETDSKKRPD